ncbi:phosphatidylinositol transfer protein 3-like isoform X2 [Mytilus galloprovincialis]
MEHSKKILELKKRLVGIKPLEDEPEFFNSEETLVRFLKSREWNINETEKMLKESIEYRRRIRPSHLDCKWCHDRPGCHSMRQVGFDEAGRPVIYSNFAQANLRHNTSEDTICHCTYLIENAKRTMPPGVSTWVFVIDCTGMTIQACNPKLGYGVTQVMANHYPERLGLVICVNHNPVFQGIWKAMKVFIHPNTSSKVKLVKSKSKVKQTFLEVFPSELTDWILEEMRQNKIKPLPSTQREFWNKPSDSGRHDPRGCSSYIEKYIERSEKENAAFEILHKAHPNIMDSIKGKVVSVKKSSELEKKSSPCHHVDSCNSDSDEEFEQIEMLDIPDEFKVPDDAVKFT